MMGYLIISSIISHYGKIIWPMCRKSHFYIQSGLVQMFIHGPVSIYQSQPTVNMDHGFSISGWWFEPL